MNGIFALVVRSLRQDSRKWQSSAIRAGVLMAVGAMLGLLYFDFRTSARGLIFIRQILWCSYLAATAVGIEWFSGSITEEKEQRSLGLLRMTNLNSLSLLFGKWLPRLFFLLLLISLQIPLAVLGITLGGVSPRQVFAGFAGLLAYCIMISGVGVLASVICETTRKAARLAGLAWLFMTMTPWLGSMSVSGLITNGWLSEYAGELAFGFVDTVRSLSLWHRLSSILSTQADESLWHVQVWGNLLIGVIAFALAWILFEFFGTYWLETKVKRKVKTSKRRKKAKKRKSTATVDSISGPPPTVRRSGRVWSLALAWREFVFNAGGWKVFKIKGLMYLSVPFIVMGLTMALGNRGPFDRNFFSTTYMVIGGVAFVIESIFYSERLFGTDAYEKRLPFIMLLPKSANRIAWGKVCGFLVALLPSVLCFIGGCIVEVSNARAFWYWINVPVLICMTSVWIAFMHLTAFFSIHTRGALLLSLGVVVFSSTILGTVVSMLQLPRRSFGSNDFVFVAVSAGFTITMLLLTLVLQFLIARSLRKKAAVTV